MTALRWRRAAAVAAAGALAVAGLVLVQSAAAAPNKYAPSIGTAVGDPLTGPVVLQPRVVTSKPCPAGTTAVSAFLDSVDAGLTAAEAISANVTDVGSIDTTGIPFSNLLTDIAAAQGKTLVNGRYELSVVCLPDLFGTPGSAQFDGVITISGGATPTSQGTTFTFQNAGGPTATTTTLVATPAGSSKLQPPQSDITLTATVSPAGPGTVQFTDVPDGGTATPLGAPVTVAADGTATLKLGSLAPLPAAGPRAFRVTYTPTDPTKVAPSTSADVRYTIASDTQTVTAVALAANPADTVQRGNPLTLVATVTTVPPGGTLPAGTVTFFDGGRPLGQAQSVNGTASLTVRVADAGTLTLRATFVPDDLAAAIGSTSAPDLPYIVSEPFSEGPFLDLLTIDQTRGKVGDAITVKAPSACPNGSSVMSARINGPGAWAQGFDVPVQGVFDKKDSAVPLPSVASIAGPNTLTVEPGRYLIAVTCRISTIDPTATGFFLARIWFYDANNWLNADPAVVGIPTDVLLTAAPVNRTALGTVPTFSASITPADAVGDIVFTAVSSSGDEQTVATVKLAGGKAATTAPKLGFGLYYLRATYDPGKVKKHNASSSPEMVYAVTKIVPPLFKATARVTGTAAVGRTVTCVAVSANATTRAISWFRDGVAVSGADTSTYRIPAADAGHLLQCRHTASNTGGTVYRDSAPVRVGR